jgi:hypothetical protein
MPKPEVPNLRTFEGAVFLDQDGTLAETDAGLKALYKRIGSVGRLVSEREAQREASRRAAKAKKTLVVPPYDLRDHLGSDPSFELEGEPYGLTEREITALAKEVRTREGGFQFPDAERLLGRLASRGVVPTILTYGDPYTQNIKALLNGLSEYPVAVVNGLKGEYLAKISPHDPAILVEDRIKHLHGLPPKGIGVLYGPKGNDTSYTGPVIKSHDELWR